MNSLAREIASAEVPQGSLRLWWLGQAGFAFKTSAGTTVFADPYLSDAVERLAGFKRLSLAPIAPEEVRADVVVLTHEHEDHLDPDTVPVVARNNPDCVFAGPEGCRKGLLQAGLSPDRFLLLEPNGKREFRDLTIHSAPADHGGFSPSALALVLECAGVRVMLTGDSSLRPDLFRPLLDLRPDLLLPCINGGFGNMSHTDAARLVEIVRPRYAIPCHFWTFAEQGAGDPWGFVHACKALCPEVEALLLKPGEAFTIKKKEAE